MKHATALFIDPHPVDEALRDASHSGPELAHLAATYSASPRALIFPSPSSDWRLLMLLLPLGSRLSLMTHPVFAQLTRTWGMGIRFIGVDRDRLVYDFRALLSNRTLELVVDLLARHERAISASAPHPLSPPAARAECTASEPAQPDASAPLLDLLFEALAGEMLTTLERRRADWVRHLDREHRLDVAPPARLFGHDDRYPDFLARLREALRNETIDPAFYGRVLRSVDQREALVDARIAALIEDALDPAALALLARTAVGRHLGCYNWLVLAPRHAAARAHLLSRLPTLASFLSETLMPIEARARVAQGSLAVDTDDRAFASAPGPTPAGYDLRPLIERQACLTGSEFTGWLRRAIDAGQDRQIIEALAARLGVTANLVRRLWREPPRALGQPPAWRAATLVRHLDQLPERAWPQDDESWQQLIERASAAQTG
ncbi:MAG: hypothetical protein ACO3AD_12405 [Burkholderiaceae bacterium]